MKDAFKGCFKDKKVLITGNTGFKGSWLTIWLNALGAEIIGYSLPAPTHPSLFESASLRGSIKHQDGDVTDSEHLKGVIAEHKPEFVFHMAAQPLVRRSYLEPVETYRTNVLGTVQLLEAVRSCPDVRVCQIITSDKCYENREWLHPYREIDPMGGHDPYSSSKGCAELVTQAYRTSFFHPDRYGDHGVSISTVRAGNVIGGGDWAEDRLIPDCIRKLAVEDEIMIRNPHAVRPWQHVLEPLSGYLWLANRMFENGPDFADCWNFGPVLTDNISVGELADRIVSLWDRGSWRTSTDKSDQAADELHEARYLSLDCSKAFRLLQWKPIMDIDSTLKLTADWYKDFYQDRKADIKELTLSQVKEYYDRGRRTGAVWGGPF